MEVTRLTLRRIMALTEMVTLAKVLEILDQSPDTAQEIIHQRYKELKGTDKVKK